MKITKEILQKELEDAKRAYNRKLMTTNEYCDLIYSTHQQIKNLK